MSHDIPSRTLGTRSCGKTKRELADTFVTSPSLLRATILFKVPRTVLIGRDPNTAMRASKGPMASSKVLHPELVRRT
jgi:hypothetical protein